MQDRVPAFSSKKAREFIAAELGAPVDILFKVFEDQPIAAASLGQVSTLSFFCLLNTVVMLVLVKSWSLVNPVCLFVG